MPHIHELYDFTVSFFILHPTEDKICLHFHKKLKFWNQLGGHIELDENPLHTIERELREEAGLFKNEYEIIQTAVQPKFTGAETLPLPFAFPLYKYGELKHWHIDLPYIIKSKTADLRPQSGESEDIEWFSREQISELQDQKLLGSTVHEICEWIFENHM